MHDIAGKNSLEAYHLVQNVCLYLDRPFSCLSCNFYEVEWSSALESAVVATLANGNSG